MTEPEQDPRRLAKKLHIGSMDCAGDCGRTVSANKGFCLACLNRLTTEAAERMVDDD